ncbi:MAG: exo-alpha-sialidase [Tepidisphaeraceae bacterium]|jgi:photosystem II stability/assembly factor-like uncharacterized protein
MNSQLFLGTRKGLFTLSRKERGDDWKIARTTFLGDQVPMFFPDPRDRSIYAALYHGHFGPKLHRSSDGGKSWTECAVPSFAATNADAAKSGPSVELIWSLEAARPTTPGTLWAGTVPGGLFQSANSGQSWQLVDSLWDNPKRQEWFGGGMDKPGIHSICVHPHHPDHVRVGVSCGGVWETRDAGRSWDCRASGMIARFMPPDRQSDPNIQDPHRLVQSPSNPDVLWAQHHNGIFRSTDGSQSWHEIQVPGASSFGFAVVVHPRDPDTAWFVPALSDERRIPADSKVVVTRTRDGGKSFDVLTRGLPQEQAYHLVFRHSLDIDDSGQSLAFGSTTGSVWTSDDDGDSWHRLSADLPPIYCVRFAPW